MRFVAILLALLVALPAGAGNPDRGEGPAGFEDRPDVGRPVAFRTETGGRFAPRRLIFHTGAGDFVTDLPATSDNAHSEDRIDLSGLPVLGQIFGERRAPIDVEREGDPVGVVYRNGADLIIDAPDEPGPFQGARLILTATLPRDGTVSFDLGAQSYVKASGPVTPGPRVGMAYVFRDALVIAADGARPLIKDWGLF